MKMEIQERIYEMQKEKQGIYPEKVAEQIAIEYNIGIQRARNEVLFHIQKELKKAMDK
jgi:hypothetical protein